MKTTIRLLACAAVALSLAACGDAKNPVSLAEAGGEWSIVAIDGQPVTAEKYPFIGIDAESGRIYGYSGCNRIMGRLEIDEKTGKAEFGEVVSTRMLCPEMELERKVLDALASVRAVGRSGEDGLVLYAVNGRPVLLLERRFSEVPVADLQGEWRIVGVYGELLPLDTEREPGLSFDVEAGRIGGSAGCNRLMGGFETGGAVRNGISFTGVATTRMACPDMETERNILSALEEVRSFGLLKNGHVAFFSSDGDLLLELAGNKKTANH